jgi:hypothetical protein
MVAALCALLRSVLPIQLDCLPPAAAASLARKQFYYAPAGEGAPPGALRAAVEHATGPQAGTVAFAGAVLAAVNALQQAAQAGRRSDGSGGRAGGAAGAVAALLCGAFRCVASIVLALVEFLCRYSLVWAALTGQGLVDAGA